MKQFILTICVTVIIGFGFGCSRKNKIEVPVTSDSNPPASSEVMPPEITQDQESRDVELDELSRRFQPIYFDFNRYDIRQDQVAALKSNADLLRSYAKVSVILEGHCDERGTDEYNLALGERRAIAVKQYLINLGIEASRLQTISYGESRPFADGHSETTWQQNRRAQSVVLRQQ
jgi:peptidoglycan-associated lipoprotein